MVLWQKTINWLIASKNWNIRSFGDICACQQLKISSETEWSVHLVLCQPIIAQPMIRFTHIHTTTLTGGHTHTHTVHTYRHATVTMTYIYTTTPTRWPTCRLLDRQIPGHRPTEA